MQNVVIHSNYKEFGKNIRTDRITALFGTILAEREREREREHKLYPVIYPYVDRIRRIVFVSLRRDGERRSRIRFTFMRAEQNFHAHGGFAACARNICSIRTQRLLHAHENFAPCARTFEANRNHRKIKVKFNIINHLNL
jgi:hypothetical protein